MSPDEIWLQLTERHPDWLDPEHVVKLRSRGLEALLRQAHQEGVDAGTKREKTLAALRDIGAKGKRSGLFDELFGKFSQ